MRAAVEAAFEPLELAESDDNRNHWRLRSNALRRLVRFAPAELAELGWAAGMAERGGQQARAAALREIETKLRATLDEDSRTRIEADVEALTQAEGLAMRAGPRPRLDRDLVALLREAIATQHIVEIGYRSQSTGRWSRQRIEPYGLLYGNRAFLVGRTEWAGGMRFWRLSNMSEGRIGERFVRDPGFDLEEYARCSFGTFQEEPVEVVLRFSPAAAPDAGSFLFHPSQSVKENADGTLTVCFTAGGIDEMCWHLVTWGNTVTVEKPDRLRRRLADMCETLATHHREAQE